MGSWGSVVGEGRGRLIEAEAGPPELSSRVGRLKEEERQLKCQRKNKKSRVVQSGILR